jgi:hypothetical protein
MVMKEDLDTAARYRLRAVEVRKLAVATKDTHCQKILEDIAEEYEHMARTRERIAKSGRDPNAKP